MILNLVAFIHITRNWLFRINASSISNKNNWDYVIVPQIISCKYKSRFSNKMLVTWTNILSQSFGQ